MTDMSGKILLIDNYDSFTWNLYHFLGDLGAKTEVVRNDAITADEAIAMNPAAIVLSPGPCTPNEAGICLEVIEKASGKIPLMGVCLGHQAIGQAFGGKVIRAQEQMHGKLSEVESTGKGLFEGLPEQFNATRYHSLIVERSSLPDCLEVTASVGDMIMGLQHKSLNVHGLQFHPESIASEHGHALLRNFLKLAGVYDSSKDGTKHG
jgi:anthranilate synthase component 2